jgi:predicted small integral membrane protein
MSKYIKWMAFTSGSQIFVLGLFALIGALTLLAVLVPAPARRGVLPLDTTRGDRIYIGLLGTGLIMILLIAFTHLALPIGLVVSAFWMGWVIKWG